jgi:ABC-type branched-subunit amino acid transport system substrate-binding protein
MTESRFRSRRMKAVRPVAIAAAIVLLAGGCGARLTAAQLAALNRTGNSNNSNSSDQGLTAGETGATATTIPCGTAVKATGSKTPGTTVPCASSGSSGSGSGAYSAGSAAKVITVGGDSSTGGSTGGSSGGGPGGSTKSGGSTVAPANDPLAGPDGKLCPAGAAGSGPGVTAKSITIGNIATINGPVPDLFTGARYGTEAFAAWVNSQGGLCGRQVEVDSADDQFDQATDQSEAQTMAGQILSFVGSFSLQDAGIPAGAPGVPDVGQTISAQRFNSPTNFSPQPNPPGYQTSAYQYFKSDPTYAAATQKMALLVENTPQTATTGAEMGDALKSIGYHFVFTDTDLQPTDPTFDGDVEKMKADGVEGVVFQATGTIIGQLANAMYQAGMKIVLGNYAPSAYDPDYIQNAGPGTDGTVLSQALALYQGQDAAQIPMVATFDQWYNRVDPGQTPDLYAAYGWLSGLLFAEGLNEGGAPTRAALLAGLKQITTFNGDGMAAPSNPVAKTPPSCFVLIDVKNNAFVRDPATPSGYRCSPSGYYHGT